MRKRRTYDNAKHELMTMSEIAGITNLGIGTVRRVATETGTLIKVGKLVRIDYNRFMQALREEYTA